MRWVVLTAGELAEARTLDDDENFVIGGRAVEIGPLAGRFVAPARMMDDPACPPKLAAYLKGQAVQECDPAELFAPEDDA